MNEGFANHKIITEANSLPTITVIIATYNAETYLAGCIQSVLEQSYPYYELFIIDGGSTDRTLSIIEQYKHHIAYWTSEPDQGIYDAWNKGIRKATGSWIAFIGSDDLLYPNALQTFVDHILAHPKQNQLEFISSTIELVDENLSPIRVVGDAWSWDKFSRFMNTWHVGAFHSSRLFSTYGLFNTSYKISGDYELLLRANDRLVTSFVPVNTVRMRTGGVSNVNLIRASEETYRAKVANKVISPIKGYVLKYIDRFRLEVRKRTNGKFLL
ncbi:MAG: glycosyltransferase [Cytophagales bacterium]|nr:MAG: glycosyltransferase [Cytophagales bacterium]